MVIKLANGNSLRIDAHVHVLGDGSSGSGCRLGLKAAYHKLLARIIVSSLGLPSSALSNGLDDLYAQRLVEMVKDSSLDAAIILPHEHVYDSHGRLMENVGSFYTPNDYVLALAAKHPNSLIPAAAIHPARHDAIDELERCAQQGTAVLKLLPNCQNVDCSDVRFKRFWQRLAELHIPFLCHTGGELSVPVLNAAYADPRTLTLPLECGVTVIAAHCGTRGLLRDPHYTPAFIEMLGRYPNLYGDNSGMNTPLRSRYFREILSPAVQERVIHGSDLPIPISALWSLLRGNVSSGGYRRAQSTSNLIERDVRIKEALGFVPDTFSRIISLLPSPIAKRFQTAPSSSSA
jgi:predicted TIM-barrel fold metal-dependent hydrolase